MRARLSLGAAVFALSLLALAQVLGPRLAASQLRDRLARKGVVDHVEVHAFPALKLLWGSADRVVVHMRSYRSSPGGVASLLAESRTTGRLDVSAGQLSTGLLTLRDARLRKDGAQLTGEARVDERDVRAALPPGFDVRPVASGDGTLLLRGTATALGARVSLLARVLASDGKLLVQPEGVPFAGLATLTVFADRHVAVQSVSARLASGGYAILARGRLR